MVRRTEHALAEHDHKMERKRQQRARPAAPREMLMHGKLYRTGAKRGGKGGYYITSRPGHWWAHIGFDFAAITGRDKLFTA